MATGYYTHADCWLHEMGPGHPESPERLDAIEDRLIASGLSDYLVHRDAPALTCSDILLAHSPEYVAWLISENELLQQQIAAGGSSYRNLDPDTRLGVHTLQSVLRAAGLVQAATQAVYKGELDNAFCAIRPPGHHAGRKSAGGFCFINNVALAVSYALKVLKLERVAIVDMDVHHGNGTQKIFSCEPHVFMVGFFQYPFFPYENDLPQQDENMLNIPVERYTSSDVIREIVCSQWMPALECFAPQMIFISAGFDAHREDDMGQLGLVETDYIWITNKLVQIAKKYAQGRIVSFLEGGYDLSALGRSVEAHIRVLAGLNNTA